ncbi:serine/threonine-protein kinase [Larkinella terrae]|uniref:Protein kinase n=1 Tax=Larkinella terrae TaxID=2025311 RepID=A0A7K0EPT1_9BACT|nr:serine/threonine-protein kinase [Larkinella terrae]MRS63486.1 protein kinase [Larkinella terrae]
MQTQLLTYTLSQKLGEGGMATVWYAENALGKRFAIKVLKPGMELKEKLAERFRLEAKMMVSLEHPHIRQVIDYHEDAGTMAIIMEYLEGEDLGRYLIERGPVSEAQALKWFNDILDAVAYVHQKNYIHRDIKPSNLFLTRNGQIKVMDFGIAKIVNANLELTETHTNIGSPQYMSPEQITTPRSIDYRTDIYSLGVTLYALLTGKKPYDDSYGSAYTVQAEIVKKPLPFIPGVSQRVNAAIQKATSKNPGERFQSCAAFKEALAEPLPVFPGNDDDKTLIRNPNRVNLPDDVRPREVVKPEEVKNEIPDPKKPDDGPKKQTEKKSHTLRNVLIGFVALLVLGGGLFAAWTYFVKGDITKGVELANKGEYTEAFFLLYKHRNSPFMTPEAIHHLGYMYNTGTGTQRDYSEALRWYWKAADQGYLLSLSNIGAMYQFGMGVAVDLPKAREYYEKAAAGGIAKAKYNLGELYFNGTGVNRNYYEAIRYYREGAEGGDAGAQFKLGLSYQYAYGVSKDYSQAEYWFRKAASQNYADAQNSLGVLYYGGYIGGNGVDYATARFWYQKAAEQNNVYSLYNLGYLHDYGQGVTQNWTIAVDYYKKAARLGYADAQKRLNQFSIRW